MNTLTVRKTTLSNATNWRARVPIFAAQRAREIALEVLFNFLLPFVVYVCCESRLSPSRALIAAAAPPLIWVVIEFVRRRRIDALSILVLAGIGLSLLAFIGGGSIRFLQLREKLVTAMVGLIFLGSAAIGYPLMYQLGRAAIRRRNPIELGEFEALKDNVQFRRTLMTMTLVWGIALMAEAAVATILVFMFSVRQYLLIGPALGYATMGTVGGWSFLYVGRQRRRALVRRPVAEEAVNTGGGPASIDEHLTHPPQRRT